MTDYGKIASCFRVVHDLHGCWEVYGTEQAEYPVHRFNQGGKLPIVAFDNDPETLDWIDRGAITATITQ